jgi:hypothetical protein
VSANDLVEREAATCIALIEEAASVDYGIPCN